MTYSKGDADVVEGAKSDTVALPHFMSAVTLLVTVTSADLSPTPRRRVAQSAVVGEDISEGLFHPEYALTRRCGSCDEMKWSDDGAVSEPG